jgi:uncharacterized RDD family membrane protein YckC
MSQPAPPPLAQPVRLAGFFSRLIAFFLDLVFISLVNLVVVAATNLMISFFGFNNFQGYPTIQAGVNIIVNNITWLTALFNALFGFVYFIFFWVLSGFTPGQGLLGLHIIRTDGQPHLNLGQAVLRFGGLWIAAVPLFLGFIWILFDDRRQGWHDKIARTYVIYIWDKNSRLSGRPLPRKKLFKDNQEE